MKKKFLILTGMLLFGMTGCGSSATENVDAYADTQYYEDSENEDYINDSYDEEYEDDYDDYDDSEEYEDDDSDEDREKQESVMVDEIVTTLKPFFELIQQQSWDRTSDYAPVSVLNMIEYVEGSENFNYNAAPYSFDSRLWIAATNDNSYYDTYFSGLYASDDTAVYKMITQFRGEEYESMDVDIEVLESNFPEDSDEFDYIKGTDSEIKLVLYVEYHTEVPCGINETRDHHAEQKYFVSLVNDGNGHADYNAPWKMNGLFSALGTCGWNRKDDVPSDFFDMTPLENEW